jgi:hypothetical protein
MKLEIDHLEVDFRGIGFEPKCKDEAHNLYFCKVECNGDDLFDWIHFTPATSGNNSLVIINIYKSLCGSYLFLPKYLQIREKHCKHPLNNYDDLISMKYQLLEEVPRIMLSDQNELLKNNLVERNREIKLLSVKYIRTLPQGDLLAWFKNEPSSEEKKAALHYAASPINCESHYFRPQYEVAIYTMLLHSMEIEGHVPDFEAVAVGTHPELTCKVALVVDHLLGFLPSPIIHEEEGSPETAVGFWATDPDWLTKWGPQSPRYRSYIQKNNSTS